MGNKGMSQNKGMGLANYLQQEHVLKAQIAHAIVCGLRRPLSGFLPWAGPVFLVLLLVNPQPSSVGIMAITNMSQCCRDFVYGQIGGQFIVRFGGLSPTRNVIKVQRKLKGRRKFMERFTANDKYKSLPCFPDPLSLKCPVFYLPVNHSCPFVMALQAALPQTQFQSFPAP